MVTQVKSTSGPRPEAATTLWSKARVNAMHRYDCICEFKFPVKNASGFGKASKKRMFLFLVHAYFSDLTF